MGKGERGKGEKKGREVRENSITEESTETLREKTKSVYIVKQTNISKKNCIPFSEH